MGNVGRQSESSQTEAVYRNLRSRILAGKLLPEQKLNISALCATLDGSLGAIREALSRLVADGLVVSEPFKGFRVTPVSISDFVHLTEARIEIEKLCLTASLARGGIEWEGRVVSLLHQLSRFPGDKETSEVIEDWSRVHADFHDVLASACENSWLLDIRRKLSEQAERYRRLPYALTPAPSARDTLAEHTALAEAALKRDSILIVRLMSQHLQRTSDMLLECLEKFPSTSYAAVAA